MDYLVFIIGLFLLIAGGGGLFHFRKDHCLSRWPLFFLMAVCLAGVAWFPLIAFACSAPESVRIINVFLGSTAAAAAVAFSLSPLTEESRRVFLLKWSLILSSFLICFTIGGVNECSVFYLLPILASTAVAGWKSCSFCNELFHRSKPSHPLLPSLLLTFVSTVCLLPEVAEFAYDTKGLGLAPERAWRIASFSAAAFATVLFAWLLWSRIFRPGLHEYSHYLRRRRFAVTIILLAATVFTLGNGAWFAIWIGGLSNKEQTNTLLSALHLGTSALEPSEIETIKGSPEEVHGATFQKLRNQLLEIQQALPKSRFTYLLGMRNDRLVFLVDAEDPENTADFSPPGLEVWDYPQKWQPELAGESSFNGPDKDQWGVWFSAVVPIQGENQQVISLLGVDYPAALWLQPIAARRLASMGVTLSVCLLLVILFAFQIVSIERTSRMDQLSDRMRDAMTAADFDVWECFLNPFKLILGENITSMMGWPQGARLGSFRRVWSRIHPEDRDQLLNLTRQDAVTEAEVRLKDRNGQWIWFSLRGHVVACVADTPVRLVGIIVNIDDHHRTQKQLQASQAKADRLALVAKLTDNAVVITDATGCIEWVNEGFTRMSGYSREEVIGSPPGSFLQKNNTETRERLYMREHIRQGLGFETEVLNTQKSGRPYLAHIECQALHDSTQTLTGFMAIVRDITQTRRSTRLLGAVATISNDLLSHALEPTLWNQIIKSLGTSADLDRCSLYQIYPNPVTNALSAKQIAEWCNDGIPSLIDHSTHREIPFHDSGCRHIYQTLSQGHELSGNARDFPEPESTLLLSQEITSALFIPIFAGDEFWGFISFQSCLTERLWEPWEISILRSAAANIGLRQVTQHESDALVLARNQAFEAAAAAEKANRAKSTFLATMSHEIRTPLNAVIGMASLLETTPLNHQQKDYAATILNSSNFLLELINDILDYSRIESGHIELDSSRFSLATVCQNAFEVVRPGAVGKKLELVCRIASRLPNEFQGDAARIRQILVNLLGNAVKFTPSGFVSLMVDGTPLATNRWKLTFEVRDSGIGIAGEALQRLFRPFVQEDSSTTRRFGGSGLGLAISKRLAAIMGGDITVTSVQGQGSIFLVTVELSVANDSAPVRPVSLHLPPGTCLNILIVDDNELNRRILEETLASWGLACHVAANAPGAIRLWKKNGPYDLVISDHHMPDMDGVELNHYLRSLPDSDRCRFALLSSESNYSPEIRAIFDEVGPKPIWPATIQSMLSRLFPGIIAEDAKNQRPPDHFDAASLETLKLLVAEDNLNNQKVIRLLLRRLGIDPKMTDDGQQALDAARDGDYDVVLLDIQMPVMDGLEASRQIRLLDLPKRPFIVALTANVFQEDRDAATAAGMDDYLSKPITLARLRETLSHFVKSNPPTTPTKP